MMAEPGGYQSWWFSISCPGPARLQPDMRQMAERFPSAPFLFYHLGLPLALEQPLYPKLSEILASARAPNPYINLLVPTVSHTRLTIPASNAIIPGGAAAACHNRDAAAEMPAW